MGIYVKSARVGLGSVLAATSLFAFATAAQASFIPIGSSLTFGGNNLPGACTDTTCADTVTFSSTPVLIDGGALSLYETQTPTGSNGEWDVWNLSTVGGGPMAGDINAYWSIVMSYTLSQNVIFDAVVDQWTVNGTGVSPITNGIGSICCATSSNPILPGDAYYNYGFSGPLSAGVQSNWQQIYVSPYSYVSAGGIDPSTANDFEFALHFTATVPEPSTWAMMLVGFAGVGIAAGLRRRNAPRPA